MDKTLTASDTGIARPVASPNFALVEDICRRAFGYRLLTVLSYRPGAAEVERVHTSNPKDYPTGGRKPMGNTPWGRIVLAEGQCWSCDTPDAVRWGFPDADKILSLGCQSMLCVPILHEGQTIGVLSLNDAAGAYRPEDLDLLAVIAQPLRASILASLS